MPVLVVGSVAFDSVQTPFGSGEEVLGGSAVYFAMAASYFTEVRMVGAIGDDFPDANLDVLRNRQVDLRGLEKVPGKTFRWRGEYGYDLNNAKTLDTQLGVLATFAPKIPDAFRDSEYVFLANVDPAIQSDVLDQVRSPRLIACDTMNFWIEGKPDALRRTLEKVDIVLINDGEARQLACETNLVRAAQAIRKLGPSIVVIKQGEYGAMMFQDGSVFSAPAFPLETVMDPTGAGDSFAGGFMGYLAKVQDRSEETLRRAIIVGSVMASLNVEDFSLRRLAATSAEEIQERYAQFQRLTVFEKLV
jgi:sugar/nucleoside kinase (ribokinase family)